MYGVEEVGVTDADHFKSVLRIMLDLACMTVIDGDYEMWMRLWGPGGFLQWTDVNGNSPAATFTVESSGS